MIFDLIVIGGGINGAGIALDAALRGYLSIYLAKVISEALPQPFKSNI